LEMVADGWCYAPLLLKQAAVETNPVERMKLSVAFAVAGLSNTCCVKKPFNPIVGRSPCTPDFPIFLAIFASLCSLQILTRGGWAGETMEGFFEDGTQVFCEQVSHHPPVTNWEVVGPGGVYHFSGSGELSASFRANSVKGHQEGIHCIDFPTDGGRITYHLPEVWVRGVAWGERIIEYDGLMVFVDEKNKLV
jgi:hypothetical protein